jgi:hypothetical protein
LTGHDALSLGMVEPGRGINRRILAGRAVTLAERLESVGYFTIGFTANPNLNRVYGFAQGFRFYADAQSDLRRRKIPGSEIVEDALKQIEQLPAGSAFYLQLLLVDAHAPREPVAITKARLPPSVAAYQTCVRTIDDDVRRLVEGLSALGHSLDDTIVIFVSDHGEGLSLSEGEGEGHGALLSPPVLEIPLLMRGPGIPPGRRVAGITSQIDLTPTILGLLGVSPDSTLPGSDWSDVIKDAGMRTTRSRAYSDTWFYPFNRAAIWTSHQHCQVEFGWPRANFPDACFERGSGERVDAPALRSELLAWRAARQQEYDAWGHTRDAPRDISVETQLEALGYTE